MILRVLSVLLALGALAALWFSYGELRVFRRTMFWEYRYIIFAVGAFLGLSLLEWALGWIKSKFAGDQETH